MLDAKFQRGFSPEKLATTKEPRIRKDDTGYFVMSLSENSKVYFDDYYRFIEMVYSRSQAERALLDQKIDATSSDSVETLAYYRARGVIVDLVMQTVRRFYTDGANLGVIMTPWCFGTVMLEKVEVYRDRLGKGEVRDANVPEFPYYVIRYIEEIYKTTLLELFDFPEKAFRMRWQYSELLKKYSRILTNITNSLNSVLGMVRNYGS
jgi:hypothetical protein